MEHPGHNPHIDTAGISYGTWRMRLAHGRYKVLAHDVREFYTLCWDTWYEHVVLVYVDPPEY